MLLGGYKIINLNGVAFNTTPVMVPGIYDAIESTNKATLVSGLNVKKVEYNDMYINFTVVGSNFQGKVLLGDGKTMTIKVENTDAVTVEVV